MTAKIRQYANQAENTILKIIQNVFCFLSSFPKSMPKPPFFTMGFPAAMTKNRNIYSISQWKSSQRSYGPMKIAEDNLFASYPVCYSDLPRVHNLNPKQTWPRCETGSHHSRTLSWILSHIWWYTLFQWDPTIKSAMVIRVAEVLIVEFVISDVIGSINGTLIHKLKTESRHNNRSSG